MGARKQRSSAENAEAMTEFKRVLSSLRVDYEKAKRETRIRTRMKRRRKGEFIPP